MATPWISDDTLDGYIHPEDMVIEDYDRFTKDEDGNPYNKGVYVTDDTLDGYVHPYGMSAEELTEFTKDEDGYPYNNGVFKFKDYNDSYPYIFEHRDYNDSSSTNYGYWKFPTVNIPTGANQDEEYEIENDGYPYTAVHDFAYRRFTKNRRGYPFMNAAWKYDANNDRYPWIFGFAVMKGDMVRILKKSEWQTVGDKLVYTQKRLKDSYWEHNKTFE